MKPVSTRAVRCAIYTRKSSEEGLEQDFNSLHAQREACAAYILSQASEGWVQIPDLYDDGGLSGGTLERPALQRLLADVAAGRIDIIVVYKVDRLTRSLLDFSRLVEAFDKADTSFVSVTQSFNTTTSMGRLTLNMLLSFAQFEREVTAERIRDKIAASKARGVWMGGIPPLGYAPNGRSLKIVEREAALVRHIFGRYIAIGNVRLLEEELARDRIIVPQRTLATGKIIGSVPFSRGALYLILKRRTYTGEIDHKGTIYPGLHPAIIDLDLWQQARDTLADHTQTTKTRVRAAQPSLLAGKVFDQAGEPLVPVHASKQTASGGKVRYRYYVSLALHETRSDTGMRIPAREIEGAVVEQLARLFDDAHELIATTWLTIHSDDYGRVTARAQEIAAKLRQKDRETVSTIVSRVTVERGRIGIACDTGNIADLIGVACHEDAPGSFDLVADVRLTRSGRAMRLVQGDGSPMTARPDAALIGLIAKAHRWWRELRAERIDIKRFAEREGVSPAYVTRVLRLAFLSPAVVDAMLAGRQRAGINLTKLTLQMEIPAQWAEQRLVLVAC